jgi:hypothetical protein
MNDIEFEVLEKLSGKKGFPTFYERGLFHGQPYVILEKLGANINEIMQKK